MIMKASVWPKVVKYTGEVWVCRRDDVMFGPIDDPKVSTHLKCPCEYFNPKSNMGDRAVTATACPKCKRKYYYHPSGNYYQVIDEGDE